MRRNLLKFYFQVEVSVNDVPSTIPMKLSDLGEAFFVESVDGGAEVSNLRPKLAVHSFCSGSVSSGDVSFTNVELGVDKTQRRGLARR